MRSFIPFLGLIVMGMAVTTNFTTQGRLLLLSLSSAEAPQVFRIRGFSYSNSRIGEGPAVDATPDGFDAMSRPEICAQDFPLMRTLHVNTIKTYAFNEIAPGVASAHKQCLDAAWNNGTGPIYVILSVWIPVLPFGSQDDRTAMLGRYTTMVSMTADHPAVMGYSIGSEIGGDPNNNSAYWSDFGAIANAIRTALGGRRKIITSGTYQADCTSCVPPVPVLGHVINGERAGVDIDVWGVDIYSPNADEPNLRANIFQATRRPLMLPEYGVSSQPGQTTPSAAAALLLQQVQALERYSYNATNAGSN
jgi:hypothetical protein